MRRKILAQGSDTMGESGAWIMKGTDREDVCCIRSCRELMEQIDEIGFLPLFRNEVEGFSAEEHVPDRFWWTGDPERDPWVWREIIAGTGEIAYGKFFSRRAGFISLKWFPCFANYRRDGYDFDARWEDGLANLRCKKIMDVFDAGGEYTGAELKKAAGFWKGGEKNFEGIAAELQQQTYLVIRKFRKKKNKKGAEYGMPVTVYARPEDVWGYGTVSAAYGEDPSKSWQRIFDHVKKICPLAEENQIRKLLK